MKAYCLFEQSGTFKNEFKRFGVKAEDYDVLNDFGETDHIVDLFDEINRAYGGGTSLFDEIKDDDIVLAFFPCTRFEAKVPLLFRGEGYSQISWADEMKLDYSMKLHEELHILYDLICKLFIVAIRKNIKMVVENPYTQPHYLTSYFPIKPTFIDKDRSKNGDYYKKPTQYWFINFDPQKNLSMQPLEVVERLKISNPKMDGVKDRQVVRSMIHPQYARRFIYNYILPKDIAKKYRG